MNNPHLQDSYTQELIFENNKFHTYKMFRHQRVWFACSVALREASVIWAVQSPVPWLQGVSCALYRHPDKSLWDKCGQRPFSQDAGDPRSRAHLLPAFTMSTMPARVTGTEKSFARRLNVYRNDLEARDDSELGKQTSLAPPCPPDIQAACWECISEVHLWSAVGTSGSFYARGIYKFGVQHLYKCQRYF